MVEIEPSPWGRILIWALNGALVAMAAAFAWSGAWVLVATTSLAFLMSVSPNLLERDLDVHTPWILDLFITLALVLHIGGLYTNAYLWFPYYDRILHFSVSALVALLALLFVYTMERYWEGFGHVSLGVLTFIIFLTTVSIGALWEVFEFLADQFLGTSNQGGNVDTMMDLIFDGVAGLIIGILGGPAIRRGWLDPWSEGFGPGIRRIQAGQTSDEDAEDAD